MMKKILCGLLILFTLFSFGGCIASYEDTNGEDDYSLQTLTEENIINGTGTSQVMSSTMTVNNKSVCKAKTMSGVVKFFEMDLKNETFEILVSCEITKGNARLVLIVDDEIVHDFALNEANQRFTLKDVTGEVCLKLAGESAGYSVTYEVP